MSRYEWPIIGIHLGRDNSRVAIWNPEKGGSEIITNSIGGRSTPSAVSFSEHDCLVGVAAQNQTWRNPMNIVYDSMRLIGRTYSEACVQQDMKLWPFKVVQGTGDRPLYDVEYMGKRLQFSAEEICSMVLSNMRELAEIYLRCPVQYAVITFPAFFNGSQLEDTKADAAIAAAAANAGLHVVGMMNEAAAAAFAYRLDGKDLGKRNVLVFDLGRHKLDVTLLEFGHDKFEVRAASRTPILED